MKRKLSVFSVCLFVIFAAVIIPASASQYKDYGTIVLPSADKIPDLSGGSKAQGTITQGQTISHTRFVFPFTTQINEYLIWDEDRADLELSIYSPNGFIGTYTDLYDSSTRDGVINVDIINNNGLPVGTWTFNVYGKQVDGSVSYTIS